MMTNPHLKKKKKRKNKTKAFQKWEAFFVAATLQSVKYVAKKPIILFPTT